MGGSGGRGVQGWGVGEGEGLRGEGAGDISSTLPYIALPHGASPQRDFAQQSMGELSECPALCTDQVPCACAERSWHGDT